MWRKNAKRLTIVLLTLVSGLSLNYSQRPAISSSIPLANQNCPAQWTCTPVSNGVVWMSRQYAYSNYGHQVVNVLDVDPAQATLRAVMASPAGQYETIPSMGTRTNALAGVNAGFACNYQDCTGAKGLDDLCSAGSGSSHAPCSQPFLPRSLLQINSYAFSTNCALRTALGIPISGTPIIKQVAPYQGWPEVRDAIGGGPNLVTNGVKNITTEGFDWYQQQAPRTAVALNQTGHLLLVTVDGRYSGADGMTIDVLASFLINELQAASGMNFDGGGSTTMYVTKRGVVNRPSGGCDRSLYNGLFVYPK